MRFFLIDKVTELLPGERARGLKAITLSDPILHDHFPDHPIMPGVLIVEAMAQLGGYLLEATFHREGAGLPDRALLTQIRQAKFYRPAGPGECLDVVVRVQATLDGAGQIEGEAHVGEARVARAELTFMMRQIASPRVHEQRRYLYALWTRELAGKVVIP